jgi:hypothetical protein
VGNMALIPQNVHATFSVGSATAHTMGPWTQPNLRNWHTYFDPSSQMLCQQVSSTATTGTKSSWHYHPAPITHARRFLAASTSNTFADERPDTDAIPVTVLLETDTLIRCSLPPTSNSPMLAKPTTCNTFQDYVKTLPKWDQDLHLNVTEKPSTVPLHELLNQKRTTLLAVSDGGADVRNNY